MTDRHRARKRFGQHFLVNPQVIEDILTSIQPQPADVIVEIGPGQGAITEPLVRSGATLHLVEFDRDLVAKLRSRFASAANVSVHEADALKFDFASLDGPLRIVGNLPYNISTPLLFRLLEFRSHILDMHFMLQKEVVDRMAAHEGNRNFGRLTVMLGCFLHIESLFDVQPQSFSPPPRVVSSVVRLQPLGIKTLFPDDADVLKQIVTQAFSQRRKTLHNSLKGRVSDDELRAVGIDPGLRAEQVPVDTWVQLANRIGAPPSGG